jgi:hypothetical protein
MDCTINCNENLKELYVSMQQKYDVAAYVWPAYTDDPRARLFFPQGMGEWEIIINSKPKFKGHKQPRKPLWGYMNEADPRVMEMQIDAAADHGVNTFIYDWYWYDRRPFLEDCLNEGYLKARNNHRVNFYLMWANHDATSLWDKRNSHQLSQVIWDAALDRHEFERVCTRIIEKYLGHPCYYRIDGKPVFSIYHLESLIRGLGGVEEARDALDWFRRKAESAGLGGLHLQGVLFKGMSSGVTGIPGEHIQVQQQVVDRLGFDSLTHYQWCHIADPKGDYMDLGKKAVEEWKFVSNQYEAPYFPHVAMGWDSNSRVVDLRESIITGNEPDKFEHFLRLAKEYIDTHPDQPPLITINSWNEWSESSYIQPDTELGYGYLEAIKRTFVD